MAALIGVQLVCIFSNTLMYVHITCRSKWRNLIHGGVVNGCYSTPFECRLGSIELTVYCVAVSKSEP